MFVTAGVWVMVIRQRERVAGVPVTARQGEMASRAQQPGTSAVDILCHKLFFVDNLEKLINLLFFVACPGFFVCIFRGDCSTK